MTKPLLEIKNATKIYGGCFLQGGNKVVALQSFDLTIPDKPAKIITIAGESGSGKTTLASLILGFIDLTSGQILFKGTDIGEMNRSQKLDYRRQVQAVFQDPVDAAVRRPEEFQQLLLAEFQDGVRGVGKGFAPAVV